ncbi:hypothetical protein EDD86DRAFT_187279 [Gorgonomyces haynaldii]|nr:hypothetical protein EDD86DRAFT_187279 [Gorgonomyces haynaldii]
MSGQKPKASEDGALVFEREGKWIFTDKEGVDFEYDEEKRGWFPHLDQEILKKHSQLYSVEGVDDTLPEKNLKRKGKPKKPEKKPLIKGGAVYVTGLPSDCTEIELQDIFKTAGVFQLDPITNEPKIKLYKDESGQPKGDALVVYLREESVDLAIELLDESKLRPDEPHIIRVQEAEFKEKKEPKQQVDKKRKTKAFEKQMKQLDWDEETQVSSKKQKIEKTVILKNMFTLKELEEDPGLILELKQDVREECEKIGSVTNVILYDLEPEGVIAVRFRTSEAAEQCVQKMHGRAFAKRRIQSYIASGHETFQMSKEDEESQRKRQEAYEAWVDKQQN